VLDQNLFGQSGTQSHPGPTDPTNEIRPTTNFRHQGVFTKTHFSEALAGRGRALQPTYPNFGSRTHLRQVEKIPVYLVSKSIHRLNLPLLRLSCK
jgi:hypothetical protein